MVDRVSRALFPISFGIFNLVFWPYLIVGADNQWSLFAYFEKCAQFKLRKLNNYYYLFMN